MLDKKFEDGAEGRISYLSTHTEYRLIFVVAVAAAVVGGHSFKSTCSLI